MASTWDPASLVGSSHQTGSGAQVGFWTTARTQTLLRWGVHLAIVALLFSVAWGLIPERVRMPQVTPLLTAHNTPSTSNIPVEAPVMPQPRRHFLTTASVPVTSRVIRSSLPIGEPQYAVRTAVSVYTVQAGDTVLGIAQQFGLEGNTLLWSNDRLADNPDFLQVGQELNILPVDGVYYTAAKSDTVESVAKLFKVDPAAITDYPGNALAAPFELTVGQQLIIPGGVRPYVARSVAAYSGPVPEDAQKGSGAFVWPVSGVISQGFWEGHHAIDISGAEGSPIVAADSGYVVLAQWSDVGYGRMVIIDHGDGYQTLYAHMTKYFVEPGQSVAKGQQIGQRGSTGNSTGYHLHFEVIRNGVRRNPFLYLP